MILDIFDSKQISIDGKFIDSYKKSERHSI